MKHNQINGNQIAIISIISGLIGGVLLITASVLSTKGYWVISVYSLVMIATFIFVWTRKYTDITFKKWLVAGTLTFTIMSYILYTYILFLVNPDNGIPFSGHLWRFAAIIGCGAIFTAVLGLFLIRRKNNSLQLS